MRGVEDNRCGEPQLIQCADFLQAVHLRHGQVCDDEIGLKLLCLQQRLTPVFGFGTDLKVGFAGEKLTN